MPTPDSLTTLKKVAVLVAPGLEEVEALTPVDVLFRAGIQADLISITESRQVLSSHKILLTCDTTLDELGEEALADYEIVFLPGGMPGTLNLKADERVQRVIAQRMGEGQPVAAICAAPSILAEAGLLEGKKATANPNFTAVLAEHGAQVAPEMPEGGPVIRDGHILTSRGMGTAADLGLEMAALLLGPQVVDGLKEAIVYKG